MGKKEKKLLGKQNYYDPASIEAMPGAGTQVLKFRGGMPLLGITRLFRIYRLANSMALLDAHLRDLSSAKALGGRGFDNYTFHTDLPPGHPMVTSQQTVDFDLMDAENAKLIIPWGMNWISTKMPDAHWLTEARTKGAKVVSVTVEYSSVVTKSDEAVIIRPATDAALAFGIIYIIIKEKLYDEEYIEKFTDLPLLVRMDTLKLLRAEEVMPYFQPPQERREIILLKREEKAPPPIKTRGQQCISEDLLSEWGNFVMWDKQKNIPFPETIAKITWAPKEAISNLAHEIAMNKGKTLFAVSMGPNQFFNGDLKDRAIFLICALTGNIGTHGGNIGSFAGNYRTAYFDGIGQYIMEDPFAPELQEERNAPVKPYFKFESAHYYSHGDKPLRVGNKLFTGKPHLPTPTKSLMFRNSNSILGNAKGHYDIVINTLPLIEMIAVNEWWWSASCEYADIVFAIDSWAEFRHLDATASVTNPFLQVFPRSPLPRLHDTRSDIEVFSGISAALAKILKDRRFF